MIYLSRSRQSLTTSLSVMLLASPLTGLFPSFAARRRKRARGADETGGDRRSKACADAGGAGELAPGDFESAGADKGLLYGHLSGHAVARGRLWDAFAQTLPADCEQTRKGAFRRTSGRNSGNPGRTGFRGDLDRPGVLCRGLVQLGNVRVDRVCRPMPGECDDRVQCLSDKSGVQLRDCERIFPATQQRVLHDHGMRLFSRGEWESMPGVRAVRLRPGVRRSDSVLADKFRTDRHNLPGSSKRKLSERRPERPPDRRLVSGASLRRD